MLQTPIAFDLTACWHYFIYFIYNIRNIHNKHSVVCKLSKRCST